MPDYSKAVIYKLVCNDLNIKDIYVGSTCNFINRKYTHKSMCNNEKGQNYNLAVYQCIRFNGGWDNFSMVMIEQFSCKNKRELETRERFWIEKLQSTLNRLIPTRNWKEYREDNKEQYREQTKKYRENNKEKIKEYESLPDTKERRRQYKKEWGLKNKERLSEKSKEYREKNKEKLSEKRKEYYEKNKEEISEKHKEYASQKYTCICGLTMRRDSKNRHEKTKKHIRFIESQM